MQTLDIAREVCRTEALANQFLSLPIYAELQPEQVACDHGVGKNLACRGCLARVSTSFFPIILGDQEGNRSRLWAL